MLDTPSLSSIIPAVHAEVAKWQTRQIQVLVG